MLKLWKKINFEICLPSKPRAYQTRCLTTEGIVENQTQWHKKKALRLAEGLLPFHILIVIKAD